MADTGFGASITFQSGFFAAFRVIEELGSTREAIETTHNASTNGWATFIPSDIKKMKRCRVQMLFDPDDTPPPSTKRRKPRPSHFPYLLA